MWGHLMNLQQQNRSINKFVDWQTKSLEKKQQEFQTAEQRNAELQEKIDQLYQEIGTLARAFTDLTDQLRWQAPEYYEKEVAPMLTDSNDPRPEWWLEEEYCH